MNTNKFFYQGFWKTPLKTHAAILASFEISLHAFFIIQPCLKLTLSLHFWLACHLKSTTTFHMAQIFFCCKELCLCLLNRVNFFKIICCSSCIQGLSKNSLIRVYGLGKKNDFVNNHQFEFLNIPKLENHKFHAFAKNTKSRNCYF